MSSRDGFRIFHGETLCEPVKPIRASDFFAGSWSIPSHVATEQRRETVTQLLRDRSGLNMPGCRRTYHVRDDETRDNA